MKCPSCGAENAEKAKFCNECGTPMARICGSCGERNAPQAKFCNECGTPLVAKKPAEPEPKPAQAVKRRSVPIERPDAERRHLSLLFCDIVGSTALSAELDPEDMREAIRDYQRTAESAIREFDGHVAQYLGDGLLVYFGYPKAHEDDAYRAVRSGLGIIEAVKKLSVRLERRLGVNLAVRVGVHTGVAVVGAVGSDGQEKVLAIGDAPNIAARIHDSVPANALVMSETTARLVPGMFEVDALGAQRLRGIPEPLELFRVKSVADGEFVPDRDDLAPLVGRDSELAALRGRWDEVLSGNGRSIVISGEAGIGKSRLVHAFRETVGGDDDVTWINCSGSAYAENRPLSPWSDVCRALFGIDRGRSPERSLEQLEDTLGDLLPDGKHVAGYLAEIGGVAVPADHPTQMLSPQVKLQRKLDALLRAVLATSERKPLVIRIEDAHWLDHTSIDFIGMLNEQLGGHRIMLLTTSRPHFKPSWSAHSDIRLNPLPSDQVARLIQSVAGAADVDATVAKEILDRADGNPLFIEELTKMVIGANEPRRAEIPATLQDSLMARLDRISPAKLVVQVGATIGRQFSHGLLETVLGMESDKLERECASLVEAEILYRRGSGADAVYSFRHALIQDAAYGSLTRRTRTTYHQQIADILGEPPEIAPPEVLAHHRAMAGQRLQAAEQYHLAGQAALGAFALVESANYLTQALDLLEQEPETTERIAAELAIRVTLGVPLMLTRGFASDEVEANYQRLYDLCEKSRELGAANDQQVFWAYWGQWTFFEVRAQYAKAEKTGQLALDVAKRIGDDGLICGGHVAVGAARLMRGALADAREHFESAVTRYRRAEHAPLAMFFGQDVGAMALSFLTWVHGHTGDHELGATRAQQALELATELRQPNTQGFVDACVAAFYVLAGETRQAETHAERLVELAEREGMPHWIAQGHATRGWALSTAGESERAAPMIRGALDAYLGTGTRAARTYFNGGLIAAELGRGDLDAAEAALDESFAFVDETDELYFVPELFRLKGELTLARGGRDAAATAQAYFEKAAEQARLQGARIFEQRALDAIETARARG